MPAIIDLRPASGKENYMEWKKREKLLSRGRPDEGSRGGRFFVMTGGNFLDAR